MDRGQPVGQTLWRAAAKGGAQALARPTGAIAPGMRADLVVLDGDDPALAEQPIEHVLDAAIFGPCRRPVRDLMSGGRWIVREGRHAREQDVLRRFRAALGADRHRLGGAMRWGNHPSDGFACGRVPVISHGRRP